ncbi:MAG: putative pterin-4-alpha-carbinolamine dehydratase [Candidatus Adlerbacteria bacterium]|nr:putative pterin-4-alpha-carbinolamine dehydratase [Candidatus Adlerbacteria bacterium]
MPKDNLKKLADKKCIPCEGNMRPYAPDEATAMMPHLKDWMLIDDSHMLAKEYHFKNFKQVMEFVNKVAAIAEDQGHHPDMSVSYDAVGIELTTHAIGGLSENDFIVAAKIDLIK